MFPPLSTYLIETTYFFIFHSYGNERLDKQASNNKKICRHLHFSTKVFAKDESCLSLSYFSVDINEKRSCEHLYFSRAAVQNFFSPHGGLRLNIFDTWRKAAPLAAVEGRPAAAVLCVGKSQVKQGRPLCTHTSASTPIHLGECKGRRWGTGRATSLS